MGSKCGESGSLGEFVVLRSTDQVSSHNLLPSPIPTGGYLSTGSGFDACADFSPEGNHRPHKRQPIVFPIKGYLSVPSILSVGACRRKSLRKAIEPPQM